MKKWEEQNRVRNYNRRIQSAKSTMSKNIPSNQRIVEAKSPGIYSNPSIDDLDFYPTPPTNTDSDHVKPSKKLSDYFDHEKTNLAQIPLYSLLKHFNLQQYAKALISRGYGYDLTKLGRLGKDDLEVLITDIKMLPGHKTKFTQLASRVTQLCFEIIEQEDFLNFGSEKRQSYGQGIQKPSTAQVRRQSSYSTPKQQGKKPSTASQGRRPLSTKSGNRQAGKENFSQNVQHHGEKKGNKTKIVKLEIKYKEIGADFFIDSHESMDDEFSRVLNEILDKYQDDEQPKEKVQQPRIARPQRENIPPESPYDLMSQVNKIYGKEEKPKPFQAKRPQPLSRPVVQKATVETKVRPKTNDITKQDPRQQEKKKLAPVRESQPKVEVPKEIKGDGIIHISPEKRSRVLDLMEKKLDANNLNKDKLNLEVKKIKEMYSSFEGAKITSTIANVDIEEMCYCFACAIQKHIEYFVENVLPNENSSHHQVVSKENKEKKENEKPSKNIAPARKEPEQKKIETNNQKVEDEEDEDDVQYQEGDNFFVYKGKKIPIGTFEEKEALYLPARELFESKSSNRRDSLCEKEDQDEVIHTEKDVDQEESGEKNEEEEEGVIHTEAQPGEELEEYDQEQFDNFLKQSLRESLYDVMKKGNPFLLQGNQINQQKERVEKACTDKQNLQTLSSDNQDDEGAEKEPEEDIEEEEEQEGTEFSFTFEESQYKELELSAEELDMAKRVKRTFDKTYNEKNLTEEEYQKKIKDVVSKEVISNFCKNLMITTKMEKEVVIVSLVYVERLIVKTNMHLNSVNWRRICFTAFVIASKIWDDESFENEHFAKVFPQYTTKEINELEKVFLDFIEYDLRVSGTDYAKYYFILRTFAEKNKRSFAIKPLNVQTVRMLQKNAEQTALSLKEHYSQNTNRTFA